MSYLIKSINNIKDGKLRQNKLALAKNLATTVKGKQQWFSQLHGSEENKSQLSTVGKIQTKMHSQKYQLFVVRGRQMYKLHR